MPQSLSYLLTHIVFSTKDRAPVLDATVRPALHAYLATVALATLVIGFVVFARAEGRYAKFV